MTVRSSKRGGVALVSTAMAAGALVGLSPATASAEPVPAGTVAGAFNPATPSRVLDTREGGTPVAPGASTTFKVAGVGEVPADASAVVLNVTATRTSAAGHVTAYPAGGSVPTASSLNFAAGQTVANAVTVPVGTDGRVALRNGSSRRVDLLADVSGWYTGGTPESGGTFQSVTPTRLLDTRSGARPVQVPAGGSVKVDVGGRGTVPEDAVAAVLNVTATRGTAGGHVTAYPAGFDVPLASNLNFAAGQTVAGAVTVALGEDGDVELANGSSRPVDLVVDIAGWFLGGEATEGGAFVPVEPTRLVDTREDDWYDPYEDDYVSGPVGPEGELWVDSTWFFDEAPGALVLNVTATGGTAPGHVTAYDGDLELPEVSTLNYTPGRTVANQATVTPGEWDQVGLYNGSEGEVDLVVDMAGFYLPPPPVDVPGATLVSADDAGEVGEGYSAHLDASADGRFVLFASDATNLGGDVLDPELGSYGLFLRDTVAGTTTPVSPTVDGRGLRDFLLSAQVSDDGRVVAFTTGAANLVSGDTNRRFDVFVHDVVGGSTTRIVGNSGRQLDADTFEFSLSRDGSTVAFATSSTRVVPGQGVASNVYLWDRATQTSTWVAVGEEDGQETAPALSADGSTLAFVASGGLDAADTDEADDLYVRDLQAGTTTLVTTAVGGGASDGSIDQVLLSEDGERIVWASDATDLVAQETTGFGDVYLRDWRSGDTVLVSDGVLGIDVEQAGTVSIDADASHLSYAVSGTVLVEDEEGEYLEQVQTVVVHEVGGEVVDLGSTWDLYSDGTPLPLVDGGARVVYTTDEALAAADRNDSSDVYLRDVPTEGDTEVQPMSRPSRAVPENWEPVRSTHLRVAPPQP